MQKAIPTCPVGTRQASKPLLIPCELVVTSRTEGYENDFTSTRKKRIITCLKCGMIGHTCKTCSNPVTSFGLIVYTKLESINTGRIYKRPIIYPQCTGNHDGRKNYSVYSMLAKKLDNTIKFLLVERKDTIGFINVIQGVYNNSSNTLTSLITQLTCAERYMVLNESFENLWLIGGSSKKNKIYCQNKLKEHYNQISSIIANSKCTFKEAEFLMPKGRLKCGESTQQCAIREFAEETGYSEDSIVLEDGMFIEDFIGLDNKKYRNVFFVAKIKEFSEIKVPLEHIPMQYKEVGNVGWFTLLESMAVIRNDKFKNMLLSVVQK
jgi:predicted NUDIX family NTP pyrophosphohydrolase